MNKQREIETLAQTVAMSKVAQGNAQANTFLSTEEKEDIVRKANESLNRAVNEADNHIQRGEIADYEFSALVRDKLRDYWGL